MNIVVGLIMIVVGVCLIGVGGVIMIMLGVVCISSRVRIIVMFLVVVGWCCYSCRSGSLL